MFRTVNDITVIFKDGKEKITLEIPAGLSAKALTWCFIGLTERSNFSEPELPPPLPYSEQDA